MDIIGQILRHALKTKFLPITKKEKYGLLCVTLPVRLVWRQPKTMHLRACDCNQISKTDFRPAAR
jgi:hypothetical protein